MSQNTELLILPEIFYFEGNAKNVQNVATPPNILCSHKAVIFARNIVSIHDNIESLSLTKQQMQFSIVY